MSFPVETWVPFEKSLCKTCIASCCHGWAVEASVADLIRLGELTEAEAAGALPEAARRLKKAGIIEEFRARDFVFVLKRRRSGDCHYLDEKTRRCRVYAKRPEICRQFPKIGPKPGHCPYRAKA